MGKRKLLPLGVLGMSILMAISLMEFSQLPMRMSQLVGGYAHTAALSPDVFDTGDAMPEIEDSEIKIIVIPSIPTQPSTTPEPQAAGKVYYTGISIGTGGPASTPLKINQQTGFASATLPVSEGKNYNIAVNPPAGTEIKSITCNNGGDDLTDVKAGSTCAVYTKQEKKAPGCGLMPNSKLCGGTCPDPKTQVCGKNKDGQCDCIAKPEKKCGAYLTPSGSKCEGSCALGKCVLSNDKKGCECKEPEPEQLPAPTPAPSNYCEENAPSGGKCTIGSCFPGETCEVSKDGKRCECQKPIVTLAPPPTSVSEPLPPSPPTPPSPEPEPPKPVLVPKKKCIEIRWGLGVCKVVLSLPEAEDECALTPIVPWLPQLCAVKK